LWCIKCQSQLVPQANNTTPYRTTAFISKTSTMEEVAIIATIQDYQSDKQHLTISKVISVTISHCVLAKVIPVTLVSVPGTPLLTDQMVCLLVKKQVKVQFVTLPLLP
jgi:hypothetical protein